MGGGDPNTSSETPKGGLVISGAAKYQEVGYETAERVTAMASLLGGQKVENGQERDNIDLVCVLDRSGSMAGKKLNLLKEAMEFVIRQLRSTDKLAIVSYDTRVKIDLNWLQMTDNNKKLASRAVNQIVAGDCTNLSGGLFEGLNLIKTRATITTTTPATTVTSSSSSSSSFSASIGRRAGSILKRFSITPTAEPTAEPPSPSPPLPPAKVCSVLLFTDGLANEGISRKDLLRQELIKQMENMDGACNIFTFGFGADHDPDMLKMISEIGRGLYYYVDIAEKIPIAFADCLGGLKSVVAQNIKLTISASHETTLAIVHNGSYPLVGTVPTKESVTIQLGDLYAEEQRDLVFELDLPALAAAQPTPVPVVNLQVTYFNIAEADDVSVVSTVQIARPGDVPSERPINELVEVQENRIRAAQALEESRKLAEQGDLASAKSKLSSVREKIASSASGKTKYGAAFQAEMMDMEQDLSSQNSYQQSGKHKMVSRGMAYNQQRSNKISLADNEDDDDVFVSRTKKEFISQAKLMKRK